MKNMRINTHHSSFSTQVGDKYFESNSLSRVNQFIAQEDQARFERFQEEHLENEDYSEIEREDDVYACFQNRED
jgi:hypothetical protein